MGEQRDEKIGGTKVKAEDIKPGHIYRCYDDRGNVRIREVDAIDIHSFIPLIDRKVFYTDVRLKTHGAMYITTFAKQAHEETD